MPTFDVLMRVTHAETWTVDAKDEAEARKLCEEMDDEVITDDTGGEIVDWEVSSVKQATT